MKVQQLMIIRTVNLMLILLGLGLGLAVSGFTINVVIEGVVRDEAGQLLKDAWIGVFDPNWQELASQTTGADGRYQLEVAEQDGYYIYVSAPYDRQSGDYLHQSLMSKTAWVEHRPGQARLRRDFVLPLAGELAIRAYDTQGHLVRRGPFMGRTKGVFYMTDLTKVPQPSIQRGIFDNYSRRHNYDYDLTVPGLQVSLGQTYMFWILWEVPGFGKVLLGVDNEGRGFRFITRGQLQILNLNYELARSRLRWLEQDYQAALTSGYTVPVEVEERLGRARRYFQAATAARDEIQQAAEADQALAEALWAHEALVLAKAQQDIERYRQGTATIQVVDPAGKPVAGAIVAFEQRSHDFLFGAATPYTRYDAQSYELMQAAGINSAPVEFDWTKIEPQEGHFDWSFVDEGAGIDEIAGRFTLWGHLLVGFNPNNTPPYLEKPFPTLVERVRRHIMAVVERYQDRIHVWNALNEGHLRSSNTLGLSLTEMLEVARTSAEAIKDIDPTTLIMLNMATPLGEHMHWELEIEGYEVYSILPYQFAEEAIRAGIPFEIVGLQFYNGGACYERRGCWFPAIDLATLAGVLDWYGSLGKAIHITEVSVPSVYRSGWPQGWWHRPWDEATQAEWLEGFYTVAFSKSYVGAITWWDTYDHPSFGFIEGGGLLREDHTPKAAYVTLKRLLTETWRTQGQGTTDAGGRLTFRGFAGEYEVTISATGYETVVIHLHVREGAENTFTITLQKES